MEAELNSTTAAKDKRRQEIREAFVEFLTCYSALRDRIMVFNRKQGSSEFEQGSFIVESFAADEAAAFKRATHLLMITATEHTSKVAALVAIRLWLAAEAAEQRDSDRFMKELDIGWSLCEELYRTMRLDLGLAGGVNVPEDLSNYFSDKYGQLS